LPLFTNVLEEVFSEVGGTEDLQHVAARMNR
jgi:hypothetical protein